MTIRQARAVCQRAYLRIGVLKGVGREVEANAMLHDVGRCQAAAWRDDRGTMTAIAERLDRRLKRAEEAAHPLPWLAGGNWALG